MEFININNSKEKAIKTGGWSNPGASFYDRLLECMYCKGDIPTGAKELDEKIKKKEYLQWHDFLKEAYLIAPVSKIKNSPYGKTPYTRSGCSYPHHAFKGKELVVSIPGLKAAYRRACQMGALKGDLKDHLERHIKELGITASFQNNKLTWNESVEEVSEFDINELTDEEILEYFEEGFEDLELDDSYFTEAGESTKHGIEEFKSRWKYNEEKHNIHYENRDFSIDLTKDFGEWEDTHKDKFKPTGSPLGVINENGGPVIIIDHKRFWRFDVDEQDAMLLHEIGHIVCQQSPKPFPKSIKELVYRIKKAIQRLMARIKMRKYKKGIHDNGYHEIEADIYAATRTSPEAMKKVLQNIYKKGVIWEDFVEVAEKKTPEDTIKKQFEKSKGKNGLPTEYEAFKKEMIKRVAIKMANDFYIKNKDKDMTEDDEDTRQRTRALNDLKLLNSKYFKKESVDQENVEAIIESNFQDIYLYLMEDSGINFFEAADNLASVQLDGTSLSRKIWEEVGGNTPEALHKWMCNNITYEKSLKGWKLKSPEEVYKLKTGICHDQSLFSAYMLHANGYTVSGQIFFVECVDAGDNPDGNAHTLTYYGVDATGNLEWDYYWFETAWEEYIGIHGPYDSLHDLKDAVVEAYKKAKDINSHDSKFNVLALGDVGHYRRGMSLMKYINSWETKEIRLDDNKLYRVTHNGVGIYEALKKQTSAENWRKLLSSPAFTWLPKPKEYPSDYISYFTKEGIDKYNELVAPIVSNIIGDNVNLDITSEKKVGDIIYRDQYQVIAKNKPDEIESQINEYTELIEMMAQSNPSNELFIESAKALTKNDGANRRILLDTFLSTITTPEELNKYMDCIEYGFMSKKDGRIDQNHEKFDDEEYFYKHYYLQSPGKLLESRLGVCWDQTELERLWFNYKGINNTVVYIEILDGKNIPSHTFLIYETEEDYRWFEHSWGQFRGIHSFKTLKDLFTTVITNHQKFNNDTESPVNVKLLPNSPSYGISCNQFMKYARKQHGVDLGDISNEIFNESGDYFKVLKSDLTDGFTPKPQRSLSEFTRKYITNELAKKYKKDGKLIGMMRDQNPKYDDDCFIWIDDNDDYVCAITYDSKPNEDGHTYISGIDVAYKYLGCGLGVQMLEFAIDHGVDALNCQYDNTVALKMYLDHGFEISEESRKRVAAGLSSTYDLFLKKQNLITPSLLDEISEDIDSTPDPKYDPPLPFDQLPEHLKGDEVHAWRAKHGIELIHKEPTLEELERIWKNWNLMSKAQKIISNNESIRLFGMDNREHYWKLVLTEYPHKKVAPEKRGINRAHIKEYTESESHEMDFDKLYFGSQTELDSKTISVKSPRGLILFQTIRAASLNGLNKDGIAKEYFESILAKNNKEIFKPKYTVIYGPITSSGDNEKPLTKVQLYHDVPSYTEVGSGSTTVYIYEVDIDKIKYELSLIEDGWLYKGTTKLPIRQVGSTELQWSITYSSKIGTTGSIEIKDIKESVMYECGIHRGQGIDGDDMVWLEQYLLEEGETLYVPYSEKADNAKSDKNGNRRKELYVAFIEWCKEFNDKNVFGSIFDKDAFTETYPFIPNEMRYFYRLANPLLCVLDGDLTFFQASELKEVNEDNPDIDKLIIFAATPNDFRVFNIEDKKVYKGVEEKNSIVLKDVLGESFDLYIQNMINKGDFLNK